MVTTAYYETMTLDDLHAQVEGTILTAGHPGYEQARRGWNLSVDQYPALIVVAADAADVAAAVRYAHDNYLGVAIQSTGHGVVKAANDAVLVITTRMNQVHVNAETQTAWVEAGAIWKPVLDAAQSHGLAPLLGSSPYVGVIGYTLGGGMGWLARKYGYSADSVNAIQVVTPDGRLRRASANENSDLFWGLRGGGGNFGVVTGMEIKLYPVKVIYGGELMYPVELYADVLRFWREWITRVPDEMTSSVTLMSFPPIPQVPEPMRGKKFVQVKMGFVGAPEWGLLLAREWLEWVTPIHNSLHVMPFSEVGTISNDPVDPMPGYIANEMFDALSDAAIDVLVRYTTANDSPLVFTAIRHMGGAMAKADRSANAIGNRDALMVMETLGPTPTPEIENQVVDYIADFKADLRPYTSGGNYLNFMGVREADERTRDAYTVETYQRLMALKAKYDPDNMFRYSFAIPVGERLRAAR
jgi:hypothetical protein